MHKKKYELVNKVYVCKKYNSKFYDKYGVWKIFPGKEKNNICRFRIVYPGKTQFFLHQSEIACRKCGNINVDKK